jgi:muramidase (phage lysozyme)
MQTGNRKAFLDMIAVSEGTAHLGDNGYNVLVGGGFFDGYADHPRRLITLNNKGLKSTAAGRYQLLSRYFDHYKALLHLPDFGPDSQDKIAIQQIRECRALDDVDAGRFREAVKKCARIWASFPGAGYGQHENRMERLELAYTEAGGTVC